MIFGEVPIAKAEGAILAHSVALPKGRLRKGQVLAAVDIDALRDAGISAVTVARLGPDDLAEDPAAAQLAQALAGPGLRVGQAATGRANLFARAAGIVSVDRTAIDAFNAVNPMITVATLPPFQRVTEGAMVATIKIISYAVPAADVQLAADRGAEAISLSEPVVKNATLIETRIGDMPAIKGRSALRTRLDRLGVDLDGRVVVDHDTATLGAAIAAAAGDIVFVLTASATSDIDDVGPAALRQAGGVVTQFGMPVDPGNLLFLGRVGDRPVIGLPGCARSPALNGADWVLERVICGVDLQAADFAAMGVGGLLKEMPTRPRPRAKTRDDSV
ncbi:molybdopterin-binding protein [Yoonia sp. SS1-5]|uniref:Molybdopterin-binding protein n=1 Tax=Yoonia rhodophyticola TaxID=3137370 RepID=A0AAN0MJ21_9RHOB